MFLGPFFSILVLEASRFRGAFGQSPSRSIASKLLPEACPGYFHNGDYKKAIDTYDDAMRKESCPPNPEPKPKTLLGFRV